MKTIRKITITLGIFSVVMLSASLSLAQSRPDGWDDYSHGDATAPDYAVVFPQNKVNTITITISPENWQAALDDMTGLYGTFGTRASGEMPQGGAPGQPPTGGEMPQDGAPGQPQGDMGGQPGGMMGMGSTENPIWITVDMAFEGQIWTNVGFHFEGDSSLMSTWSSGIYKLPFKLGFDEFEDDYPEIDNQRFYGFEQLSFSSNWNDSSFLREKVTADIFREAGVPSAQTAFYAVYVDYGDGPIYFGLYTAVEVVDDTVIETQFADSSGNVYKPEGTGATFAAGSFNEEVFDKETNESEADYSDVLALYNALHAETRTTDPATWRSNLEAVFDADGFIRWLAVNTVVQNWNTYGNVAYNYYLYNNPSTGKLTWIPWNNNMALSDGMGRGMGGGGGFGDGTTSSLDLENISSDWPLIRYLMDDPVYHIYYVTYVSGAINGAFNPAKMTTTYQTLHDLIAPYVASEIVGYTNLFSVEAFDNSLTELINHVNERYAAAQEYLSTQAQ
jgi:spore coat protein H